MVCEMTIILSHVVWFLRFRHLIKEAAEQGKTIDEVFVERGIPTRFRSQTTPEPDVAERKESTPNSASSHHHHHHHQRRPSDSSTIASHTLREEKPLKVTNGLGVDVSSTDGSRSGSEAQSPHSPVPSYHTTEITKAQNRANMV